MPEYCPGGSSTVYVQRGGRVRGGREPARTERAAWNEESAVVTEWERRPSVKNARNLASLTLAPTTPQVTLETVTALLSLLRTVPEADVVLDLRSAANVDREVVNGIVAVDRWLRKERKGGLAVRVTTRAQLAAFMGDSGVEAPVRILLA